MPLWSPSQSSTNYFQLFDFFTFSGVQRVSRFASLARFHGQAHPECRPHHPPQSVEHVWFTKVVCTLCIRYSQSLNVFSSDYFRRNLSSSIASGVIRHVISNYRKPTLAFRFFECTRLNLNLIHSVATYNLLLRSFSQMGLHDSAKWAFDYMMVDGYLPDNSLLGFLVSSSANAGKFEIGMKMLLARARCSSEKARMVDSFVYNDFLSLLVKRDRVDEAVGFFRDHILRSQCCRPDTCTLNILIRGLCKVGEVDKAFELFSDIGSFGCLPDVITYNTLTNGFCRVGRVDRALELLREISSPDGFLADVVTYTSVVSGFCKLGKMEEALSLFDEMIRNGIKPNIITFNVIIDGFGKASDTVTAMRMYERMLILGCPPDVITFSSLIDGHCRMGQLDQGLNLWAEMNARKLSPNVYTFSILINALCKGNRLNEARGFLRQLKLRSDIVPQAFVYNPVIDGFCKAGNVDEANVIVTEMEEKRCKPDKLTFTILILGHCMKGRMGEAITIFKKMLAVGCAPDSITINSFISCLLKAGMPNEARKIRQTLYAEMNSGDLSSRRNTAFRTDTGVPVAI
ncbi:hypothetical protein RJ639_013854 [Escallonia herrerae]|uniref:Pentatricopeptide repeat-containing protein n=1 Tax=Escallonia herrerae TaxID=1293975 RepID=A0AA89AFQ4_9ASTE|nr:hypothetical protein RJ639_021323 [Escallonia herrerae]KAK3009489.1 hypothetical protein RJ639_013854 [Escallonia herrerae]